MEKACAMILAAGDGKRMKSAHSKVLCRVLFEPMISHVLRRCDQAGLHDLCVVISDKGEEVRAVLPKGCRVAIQSERKGTGHAVMMGRDFLEEHKDKDIVVLFGDAPFADADTIRESLQQHRQEGNAVTIVAAELENPTGYGRIVQKDGRFEDIVEEKDADEATKQIRLINAGICWYRCDFLLGALDRLTPNNAQGEYYLTQVPFIAKEDGKRVGVYRAPNTDAVLGANDRKALHELGEIARMRKIHALLADGVDIPCFDGVMIAETVEVGSDTTILPGTLLQGGTVIGSGCTIGPNVTLRNVRIGSGATVSYSVCEGVSIAEGAVVGPYSHLHP